MTFHLLFDRMHSLSLTRWSLIEITRGALCPFLLCIDTLCLLELCFGAKGRITNRDVWSSGFLWGRKHRSFWHSAREAISGGVKVRAYTDRETLSFKLPWERNIVLCFVWSKTLSFGSKGSLCLLTAREETSKEIKCHCVSFQRRAGDRVCICGMRGRRVHQPHLQTHLVVWQAKSALWTVDCALYTGDCD